MLMAEAGIAPSRQLPTQHHGAAFEGSHPFPPQVSGLTASRAFDICTHEGLGKKRRGPAVGQHPAAQGKARASGCCRQRFANFLFFFFAACRHHDGIRSLLGFMIYGAVCSQPSGEYFWGKQELWLQAVAG